MSQGVAKAKTSTTCMVNSTCPYCGVGCGVDVVKRVDEQGVEQLVQLKGTPEHPANFGRLCVKGSHLLDTLGTSQRLSQPKVEGQFTDWSTATDVVAKKFNDVITRYGSDAVAFYVSGQLLTEDYYVANKLMKGFIGTANIDTNSRLCMSSAVAAYKRAFGSDTVPVCYEDLEQSDLLVFIGSNAAWTHPVIYQRIERAKQINPDLKIVVIDPRETATCALADLHLGIAPGSDVALFNGLLAHLEQQGALNPQYIDRFTEGFDEALATAKTWSLDKVAQVCGVPKQDVARLYEWFAGLDRVVSLYSMGVNQSTSGVDKANAIINCHLAMGKIGKPGCGPFSLTGQPNAMGGREVGGLSNLLAAHMDIDNGMHRRWVQDFWQSPKIADKPGYKAVDLFEAMAQGKIKAVWVMGTNPLVSMPNRNRIEQAFEKCDFVVVSDCVSSNDTLNYADVCLPAAGWSEKDGTVTNSERRISRQKGLMAPYGESRPDWQIICEVAQKMGFSEAFDYQYPSEIFAEFASLTAYQNNGLRDLDLSGLSCLNKQKYDQLKPVQWPVNERFPDGCKRLFSDGHFYTRSGKAQFIATEFRAPAEQTSESFPFRLNSGRLRDQWHTMTRTGRATRLWQHTETAFVAMHPEDARQQGFVAGDLIELVSPHSSGQVVLPLSLDPGLRRGEAFVPIHWSKEWSSHGSIAFLYSNAQDPISGQPELKHTVVQLSKVDYQQTGQIFSRNPIDTDLLAQWFEFWLVIPKPFGYLYCFATDKSESECVSHVKDILQQEQEWLSLISQQALSACATHEDALQCALFISKQYLDINSDWIHSLFDADALSKSDLAALLRAEPEQDFLLGKTICSCFEVKEQTIKDEIEAGCQSVTALGEKLKCGTNCGSCKPELGKLIKAQLGNIPVETSFEPTKKEVTC